MQKSSLVASIGSARRKSGSWPMERQFRAHRAPLAFAQLLFKAFDFLAELSEAVCDRDFIQKKNRPDGDPCSKQEPEVLHMPPFVEMGCKSLPRFSNSNRRSSTSWRSRSRR